MTVSAPSRVLAWETTPIRDFTPTGSATIRTPGCSPALAVAGSPSPCERGPGHVSPTRNWAAACSAKGETAAPSAAISLASRSMSSASVILRSAISFCVSACFG